jgi:hypothetical protein
MAGYTLLAMFGAGLANGDVGDLGPPAAELEIKGVLTDFYNAGHPLGSTIDVQFDGPILVGQATEHANPLRNPGVSAAAIQTRASAFMYPVKALVTVTQGQESSALAPPALPKPRPPTTGRPVPARFKRNIVQRSSSTETVKIIGRWPERRGIGITATRRSLMCPSRCRSRFHQLER